MNESFNPRSHSSVRKGPLFANRQRRRTYHRELSPEAAAKLKEIEDAGEPLSIAETISLAEHRAMVGQPRIEVSDAVDVTILQRMDVEDLRKEAAKEGVVEPETLDKSQLIFSILKERVKTRGIMCGNGTLQILPDGFGFLRSADFHYLNCPDDIYVSPSQIRKFNLKNGSIITGQIRPPKENERYFALLRVQSVNGLDPTENARRKSFDDLTALHPNQRIIMEHDQQDMSTRVVDMFTPIGFGQRGLIVSPPRAGKTILMQRMAKALLHNYPEAYVIMLLIDERPEEVTDMEREVKGPRCEVVSSTFDEPASRHILVSEMVLEKAKRLVESGVDVVIFLDSITRLSRAWNSECPQSGKTLSGGLDANAMQKPKAFFGSARKVEEGGSLTILATALIDTGSKMDDVIFEEFKGTGNLEIVLDRSLVDRRIWPAIDLNASGTRREEKLFDPEEYHRICLVRRVLAQMNSPEAMEKLTDRLRKTKSNAEFLLSLKPGSV
jgi:transcription termination factor Rho